MKKIAVFKSKESSFNRLLYFIILTFFIFACSKQDIDEVKSSKIEKKAGLKISTDELPSKIHEKRLNDILNGSFGFKNLNLTSFRKEEIYLKLKNAKNNSEKILILENIGLINPEAYFSSIKLQFQKIAFDFENKVEMKNWSANQKKNYFIQSISFSPELLKKLKKAKLSCDQCMNVAGQSMDLALVVYKNELWNAFASSSTSSAEAWWTGGWSIFDVFQYFDGYWAVFEAENKYYNTLSTISNTFNNCMAGCIN